MLHAFSRTEMLIGRQALEKLNKSRVAVFGIGGVGTFAVEGLVRSGIGKFVLVDGDLVCLTNLNRQIHATRNTIGRPKVSVMRERILEINPDAEVVSFQRFYQGESSAKSVSAPKADNALGWEELLRFHRSEGCRIDYIIDAIDTVSAKMDLAEKALAAGIPIICSMGAGNKLDPTRFEVADLFETVNCPLARVMRRELRKRGITSLKVVYSPEEPLNPIQDEDSNCTGNCVCPENSLRTCHARRSVPGSVSFVPSVAGLILAGEVIKDLIGID